MRRLPPLDTRRAFEATARHESCAKAADELTVMCRAVACASSFSCWTETDVPIKATAGMRIQWTDAFTAGETVAFAHAIGLVPCSTPLRSPQSNGIAEAFVKTFKRDYVRLNPRPDANAVMVALARWFEDYNETHPHRALGMRSPRQFLRAHRPATCPA